MTSSTPTSFMLGSWTIEPLSGSVIGADGDLQHIEPKVMDVLVCLALRAKEVVSREHLLDFAWSGNVLADEQLTRAISELRHALHDDPANPEYIETIPKRGYRLIKDVGAVEFTSTEAADSFTETSSRSHWHWVAITTIAGLLIAVGYAALDRNDLGPAPTEVAVDEKSIAVLPFVNMSDDAGAEYFSDGFSEEIIILLGAVPELKVIGRTSSFSFKGKSGDLRDIGQKLGVTTLLEGSVRKSGDMVRIVAQLIDAADGTQIWSATYDREVAEVFAVQDDIVASVVDTLNVSVATAAARVPPTGNSEAYTEFLKARLAVNRLEWREAAELLEHVVRLDPQFAEAHELLAYSYWYAAYNGIDAVVAQRKANEAAATAIALNPDLIFAQKIHRTGDVGSTSILRDFAADEWAYNEQANNPKVLDSLVYNLTYAGYKKEAVEMAQRYAEIDPLSLDANLDLLGALFSDGQVEEAMQVLDIVNQIGLGPSNWQWTIAGIMLAEGDDESATDYFEALLHLHDYQDSSWVRELVTAARDPVSGQSYLDQRIPEIAASLSEDDSFNWRAGLTNWYLYFGFIDRYYELVLADNPAAGYWSEVDEHVWHGHAFRQLGFTAHSEYLRLAANLGIVDVWEQRGAPDFCRKSAGEWICQ